jgi:type IV pilus assembly protein PilW
MKPLCLSRRRSAGLTLIELMVALLGGMLLTAAVFAVLSTFEGRKRTLNAGNDLEQAGQVALYKLDGWIRSAGAGMPQSATAAYGCPLYAAKDGAQLLPRTAALPAPFASVNPGSAGVFRLAPVLILPGQTTPGASGNASDALVVMTGVPQGGIATMFSAAPEAATLKLVNSVDFGAGDLVLVADRQTAADNTLRPCMVQQVASGFSGGAATAVPLGGHYAPSSVGSATLTSTYTDTGFALRLGNTPGFLLLGVGEHNVLYSYDLLKTGSTDAPQAEADAVFELHALYGVDTNDDGTVDAWVPPSGSYTVEALSAGTPAAALLLRQIKAVRVGLILRSSLPEKDAVTPGPLTLFTDLDADVQVSRSLSGDETHYRYRTLEETVPVRNNLLVSGK